jgi:hypothetical protein
MSGLNPQTQSNRQAFESRTVRHALEQLPTSSCDDYGIFDFN